MAEPPSRYGIDNDQLKEAARNLQLGQGISDRVESASATQFIVEAEDWTEEQVEEYIGVPLKATRAPGEATLPSEPTNRNFPLDFIQAVVYRALGRLLHSEYFENAPNASESGTWALELADSHILEFRSKRTVRVGAGRLRHVNPFMPPQIAPREETDRTRPDAGRK